MRVRLLVAIAAAAVLALAVWALRNTHLDRSDATRQAETTIAPKKTHAPAPPRRHPVPTDHVEITGIIVTSTRQPIADAQVKLRAMSAVTGDNGRFRFVRQQTDGDVHGHLAVRAPEGLALDRVVTVRPQARRVDLGRLVVRSAVSRRIRVLQDKRPVPGAHIAVRFTWGPDDLVRRLRTDAQGIAVLDFDAPEFVVMAWHPGSGRAKRTVRERDKDITLTLKPARTMRVRVLDGNDKKPVAGARVTILDNGYRRPYWPPLRVAPTNADGWTTVAGIAKERIRMRAEHEDYASSPDYVGSVWVRDELELVLPKRVTVHWPIIDGELPAPPEGTPIRLSYPEVSGVIKSSLLVFEHPSDRPWFAFAPDGSIAYLGHKRIDITDVTQPASFRRPRLLVVKLK